LSGEVAVLAFHESRLDSNPYGIVIPATTDNANWHGVVIGVGDGVRGLEWGDVVGLSGWTGVIWINRPLVMCNGVYGPDADGVVRDGGRELEIKGKDKVAMVVPEQILWRWTDFAGLAGLAGALEPFPRPVASRLLVRHVARPEVSAGGVALTTGYMREWSRHAEVVAVGDDVEEIETGHWVILETDKCGVHFKMNGSDYSMVCEGDVAMVLDVRPEEVE
jgi:co-chaperonin GroES (HSP10)